MPPVTAGRVLLAVAAVVFVAAALIRDGRSNVLTNVGLAVASLGLALS